MVGGGRSPSWHLSTAGLAPSRDRADLRGAGGAAACGAAWGISPGALTAAGWLAGVGACTGAALRLWPLALWLGNRVLDGLDGPVPRVASPTERGGFLGIVADFSVYGGFVVGVAIGCRRRGWPAWCRWPPITCPAPRYMSGPAFLALSSLQERRAQPGGDERSLRFAGGLAEGTETVVVCVLSCLLPWQAAGIAWGFAIAVGITPVQRVVAGLRLLGEDAPSPGGDGGHNRGPSVHSRLSRRPGSPSWADRPAAPLPAARRSMMPATRKGARSEQQRHIMAGHSLG